MIALTEALARRFKRFAEMECRGASALYEQLALSIAADHELLALAAHTAQGQPVPNLFMAAVHHLLLQGQADPLAQFYPSLTAEAASPETAYPAFRAFCLAHAAEIQRLLTTRRVQTNDVGRCAYLFPAFSLVASLANDRPLALADTINQFSGEARDRLTALLAAHAATRDLYRVSAEWLGTPHPQLELTAWHAGQAHHRLLAYCDHHGRWLEWLDRAIDTSI